MAMTSPLQHLGQRVKRRRLELGISRLKAAQGVDMSKDTWAKVENGEKVRGLTYARVDEALQWAPGSCAGLLDGKEPVTAKASAHGGVIAQMTPEELESEYRQALQNAAVATTTSLPAAEIRRMNDEFVKELRRRGILTDVADLES